jgi:hypothetical protein
MQLGTKIGKMTRKLFTGFSKSRPWMLNTGDQMEAHRRSDRRRVYLCAGGLPNRQSDGSGTDAVAGKTGTDARRRYLLEFWNTSVGELREIECVTVIVCNFNKRCCDLG